MKKNIGIIGIIILLSSCWGEIYCPEFPDSKLNWIPYQENAEIKFSFGNDTIKFSIDNVHKTDGYSYKKNCDCACGANAGFQTKTNLQIGLRIEGFGNYYEQISRYEYSFIKYGGEYNSALRSDDFYFSEDENLIPELKVNGIIYNNVIEMRLDTIGNNSLSWDKPEIWRILLADSIGIIQFENRENNTIWKLVKE